MSKEKSLSEKIEVFNAKTIVGQLENIMTKVTEEEVSPNTVNAACNCAARITDILKLHLEAERLNMKKDSLKKITGRD